jgi:ABC-2 type transport system ATP-binding protein
MLSLNQFEKAFGSQVILKIEDLNFEEGIHWIKGKNGSGKSTLFNCLAGLSPFEGSIKLGDLDLRNKPSLYKMKVNYSQAEPVFPEFLTGNEMIHFFAKLKQTSSKQVKELIEQLGVNLYADQPCGTYSSGMIKKLSIVIAFLGSPALIILDEPLITLDSEAQKLVSQMIVEARSQGVSFLFSTHQDFDNALIKAFHSYVIVNHSIKAE